MLILYIKAFHIIFVVTWFTGMFYLVRLFVYNREAQDKSVIERDILHAQFSIMIRRLLYGITLPSAILTLFFGLWLIHLYGVVPTWLIIKLILVGLLYFYHGSLHKIASQQARGIFKHTSNQLRLWNELPTLFLVSIVMLVVVKSNLSPVYGILGVFALAVLIYSAIRIYSALRGKSN